MPYRFTECWERFFPWTCPACLERCQRADFCGCGQLFRPAEPMVRWFTIDDKTVLPVGSLMELSDPGKKLLHRIKYDAQLQWMGPFLRHCRRAFSYPFAETGSVLVPVPSRRSAWLWRGFNPAEEIARSFAEGESLTVDCRCLVRRPGSAAQVGKNRKERLQGIKNQYRIRSEDRIRQKIILVDDVVTTGATLKECARILVQSGCQVQGAWTLFRA